jgi:hypothetical protein
MANLKYYQEEKNFPVVGELYAIKPSWKETYIAVRKLSRHFKITMNLEATRGSRRSHYHVWSRTVRLNTDDLSWGLIAHEAAHALHHQKYGRVKGEHWHGKLHRRLMTRIAKYIVKLGWHTGALIKEKPVKLVPVVAPVAPVAIPDFTVTKGEIAAGIRGKKLAKKQKHVAKLERRIKLLTTLVKKHKRSISALLRVAAREAGNA